MVLAVVGSGINLSETKEGSGKVRLDASGGGGTRKETEDSPSPLSTADEDVMEAEEGCFEWEVEGIVGRSRRMERREERYFERWLCEVRMKRKQDSVCFWFYRLAQRRMSYVPRRASVVVVSRVHSGHRRGLLERSTILLPVTAANDTSDDGDEDEKDDNSNHDGDGDGDVEIAHV